jgi:ABC-type multidrug transport system fused ATPase/permease subunit
MNITTNATAAALQEADNSGGSSSSGCGYFTTAKGIIIEENDPSTFVRQFVNSWTIERIHHRAARFGSSITKDVTVVMTSSEGKESYIKGVITSCLIMTVGFVLWIIILLVVYCRQRRSRRRKLQQQQQQQQDKKETIEGVEQQQERETNNVEIVDDGNEEEQDDYYDDEKQIKNDEHNNDNQNRICTIINNREEEEEDNENGLDGNDESSSSASRQQQQQQQQKSGNLLIMKSVVIFCSVCIIIASIVMVAKGAVSLRRSVNYSVQSMVDVQAAVGTGVRLLRNLVHAIEKFQNDMVDLLNLLNNACPDITDRICDTIQDWRTCNNETGVLNDFIMGPVRFFVLLVLVSAVVVVCCYCFVVKIHSLHF